MTNSNTLTRARDFRQKKGTIQLVREGTKFVYGCARMRIALQARIINQLCDRAIRIYDRSDLADIGKNRHYFGESESIKIDEPAVGPVPAQFQNILQEHHFDKPFVCEIKDALVMPQSGVVLARDGGILLETLNSRRDNLEAYFLKNPRQLLKTYRQQHRTRTMRDYDYDLVCSLLSAPGGEGGYSGWVRSLLPRLEAVQEYEMEYGNRPKLLLEADPASWKVEWLDLLGYQDDVIYWNDKRKMVVRRLVVPSVRRIPNQKPYYEHRLARDTDRMYKSVSPSALNWVRNTTRKKIQASSENSRRILISRSDAEKRRINNQTALKDELEPLGFEQYVLSELSVRDQVELFAEAEAIVAPHGAGLANTIVSRDTIIIEIFGAKIKPTFYTSAAKLGHKYGLVCAKSTNNYIDILVDPDKVVDALDSTLA